VQRRLPGERSSGFHHKESKLQRLREKYEKEVVPAMIKEFGYRSIMAVP
jgi:hypothetical protein